MAIRKLRDILCYIYTVYFDILITAPILSQVALYYILKCITHRYTDSDEHEIDITIINNGLAA